MSSARWNGHRTTIRRPDHRPEGRREILTQQRRPLEGNMEFGYFTLSDNHYENNERSANQFVADITAEALYADELGMNSAWIGEHHFNSLGVLSCPDIVLGYIAANTTRIRLAPAVTLLAAVTTSANTCRSTCRLRTTREFSKRVWSWCANFGARRTVSHITANTIRSTMCGSRRSRSNSQSQPTSDRSRSRRLSSRPGSVAGLSWRHLLRRSVTAASNKSPTSIMKAVPGMDK